jgi:protein-S-isoprenylcysteine O-methyltransferase Ste14
MFKINWKLAFSFALTIIIPLLYLVNIYVALVSEKLNYPSLNILGVLIALVGLTLWIASYINLGRSFGVLPQKNKKVKKGLYKYFKHPMYIGISATLIGISIANSSFVGLSFYSLVILPMLIIRASFEEKGLKN